MKSVYEESGRPSAGFIPTRSLTLPSCPYGKAVKPAFPIGHAGLAPVPWAPSPPRRLPLLLPRTGETVAVRAVHILARSDAQSARPRRPSVPDRTHFKGEAVTANCLLPSARSAFRSLAVPPFLACSSQQSVRRAGLIPPSLPRVVQ